MEPSSRWSDEPVNPNPPRERRPRPAQVQLATLLLVTMIGSLLAWFVSDTGLSESGLYFIAVPGTMAILVTLMPGKATSTGFGIFRGTSIAILSSAIIIREGFICVLMALPLILPVVGLISWSSSKRSRDRLSAFLVPLALLGLAGEGVVFDLPARIRAAETRMIETTSDELWDSLESPAVLPELEPLLFALPFPKPTAFTGAGADVGDFRIVEFGEMGRLTLQVSERTDQSITWATIEDTTPMSGWMVFHETRASWIETDAGLELTITIDFSRSLAPALYFDPLQRWGVGEMAEVLMDMIEHNLVEEVVFDD